MSHRHDHGGGHHGGRDHGHHGDDHAGHRHGGAHAHRLGHVHAPADFGRAFAIGIGLNTAFVAVEAAYGFASNSIALVADAGHNLSDVLGLAVAWLGATLARRAPSTRFTYGLRGSGVLAALANAVLLLAAVWAIAWELVLRLLDPQPVGGVAVMAVAAAGIAVNGVTAWLFASGRNDDLNIRSAYLHMAADAAVSAGVVAAGLVILLTGWVWLDPAVSLAIAAVIVVGTWDSLRESVAMSLDAVPAGLDLDEVRRLLGRQPGVAAVHDLHVWPIGTTETALTAHLVVPAGHPGDAFLLAVAGALRDAFGIGHATLQIERDAADCPLAREHVL